VFLTKGHLQNKGKKILTAILATNLLLSPTFARLLSIYSFFVFPPPGQEGVEVPPFTQSFRSTFSPLQGVRQRNQLIMLSAGHHTDLVLSVSFSLDGTRIISGSADNSVGVWDAGLMTGKATKAPDEAHTDIVSSVAFSLDETYVVSGSLDDTMRKWDSKTGEHVMKKHVSCLHLGAGISRQLTRRIWFI